MATKGKISEVLHLLMDANLDFPPKDIGATAGVWQRVLHYIPDADLEQAALDWIALERKFPTIADVRKTAETVHAHNGNSIAGDKFHASEGKRSYFSTLPTDYQTEYARLKAACAKTGKLPSDDELYQLELLSGRVE